jgi:hypothetical protein
MRGVSNLANQLLDHVFEGHESQDAPFFVHYARHVRSAALKSFERVT